jgi:hypothetical protein
MKHSQVNANKLVGQISKTAVAMALFLGMNTKSQSQTMVTPGMPSVNWAMCDGGQGYDEARSVATDSQGNHYIVGSVSSASVPALIYANNSFNGGGFDAYIMKVTKEGQRLWVRFIGGQGDDFGTAICIAADGHIYVAGNTSTQSGLAHDGIQSDFGGGSYDAFVMKLSGDGTDEWTTYFGGMGDENIKAIKTDLNGKVIFGGHTGSPDIQMTNGAQTTFGGGISDGFVGVLNPDGTLVWNTYLGGSGEDTVTDIAITDSGTMYACGTLANNNIAVFNGNQYHGGESDGFVCQFTNEGPIAWAQLTGGSSRDEANAISLDQSGNVVLVGSTASADVAMLSANQTTYGGGSFDAYITRYNNSGIMLWSTLYGGSGFDKGSDVHVNFFGEVYVALASTSTGLASENAFQENPKGGQDVLVAKMTEDGEITWASYLGGSQDDEALGINVTYQNKLTVVGRTLSFDFNEGELIGSYNNSNDIFLSQVADCNNPYFEIHATEDSIFCEGETCTFCAGGGGATAFEWITGDTTVTARIDTTMWVHAVGFNSEGCKSLSNRVPVVSLPTPDISSWAEGPVEFCDSGTVVLHASGTDEIEWSNGEIGESILATEDQVYVARGTGDNGCKSSSEPIEIIFHEMPTVVMAAAEDTVCVSGDPVALLALPLGGFFQGDGVSGSLFDPSAAGGGMHQVTYSYISEFGCVGTADPIYIDVFFHPTVLLTAADSACTSGDPIQLIGYPEGGVFNGDGVVDNMFYPNLSGMGTQGITYSYLDANGCTNVATENIVVDICTNIDEATAETFMLYPNPAETMFNIEPSGYNPYEYRLYSVTGQLVKQGLGNSRTQIDTDELVEGIYQVSVIQENRVHTMQLVINH